MQLVIASLFIGCSLSAAAISAAEPEQLEVLLQEGELLYRVFLTPPSEGQPRLAGVEMREEDDWVNITDHCGLRPADWLVGFPAKLTGQARLVFKDANSDKNWVSPAIVVRDGRPAAEGGAPASAHMSPEMGATVAESGPSPDQVGVSFQRSGTGYSIAFEPAVLGQSLDLVQVKDVDEGGVVQNVDRAGAPRDPADPSPLMYDRASGRLSFNAAYSLVFASLPERVVFVFTDDRGGRYESQAFPKSVIAPVTSNATTGASLPFADSVNTAALRAQLGEVPELDKLVVSTARTWQFHPTGGALIFRYDHYPEATAKKIAEVLGKTAKDLESPTMTVEEARTKMKEYFEQFYESGDRPYSVVNVYEEDWKPFLKHLQQEVENQVKVPEDPSAAKDMWKLAVVELADGFEQLAKEIVDAKSVVDGGTITPSGAGGTYGTSESGRRRVSCWNLLFGL
jgi:hypothetical protein